MKESFAVIVTIIAAWLIIDHRISAKQDRIRAEYAASR